MLLYCYKMTGVSFLTDAFCAHFAIPIWTLAGEGAFCIETLLTGLAVVTVPFTLIHICFCETIMEIYYGYISGSVIILPFLLSL